MIRDRILTDHEYLLQNAADARDASRELIAHAQAAIATARRIVSRRRAEESDRESVETVRRKS